MRVEELHEENIKKVAFTFGRLNPPHFGHHALIQTLQKTAQQQGCDWFLFVSAKTGDEKNPLTYEQKIWWIQALFPETKGHIINDASIKTPLIAATWLYKQGYRAATFVAGEDDMTSYGDMIKGGNAHGQKNPNSVKAGKGFIFNPLDFAISPRLASATNARRNVTDGDPEAFVRSILGPKINPKLADLVHNQLYPTLRKAMGLGESVGESAELSKSTPNVRDLAKKYATDPSIIHRQVNRGVKVEFEHTNDIEVATEIAMDHLGERLDYYDLLDKLEKTPTKKFGENFADGKGPGRPGDSQRHGIPKGASISQLEKASHAKGRKGQLARWQLNMRRGKKKANEEVTNEVADQPYRFISPVSTATTQKSMFQTDSGTTIQVFIQVDTGNGVADIGFFDATDKDNPTIGVTGKGDAFRIFATVGSIVKQFVAKRKPPYISFSGKSSDAGRIKLYDMIAKNIGRYLPEYKLIDSGFANGDKGYTFKRVAQESVTEAPKMRPFQIVGGFEYQTQLHKFEAPSQADAERYAEKWAVQNVDLIPGKAKRYFVRPITKFVQQPSYWTTLGDSIEEEKKPKKPKTIIDGALKTLIAKGRSEDEAIADLKKEIDSKFYDLDESLEEGWKSKLAGAAMAGIGALGAAGHAQAADDPGAGAKAPTQTSQSAGGLQWLDDPTIPDNLPGKVAGSRYPTRAAVGTKYGSFINDKGEKINAYVDSDLTSKFVPDKEGEWKPQKFPTNAKVGTKYGTFVDKNGKKWDKYVGHDLTAVFKPAVESWSPMELAIMEGGHLLEDFDESLEETLKKVKGKWALVSRKNPKKVLQYYHGSGHPSKDWVSGVEQRVHSFESIMEDDAKPRVYLDMDGVLADFFGEWSRISDVDHYKDINDVEAKLQLVRDHPTFWIDLPMLPHAKALVKTVIEKYGEYRICSKPLEGDVRSKPGKMDWIKKHLSDMMPVEIVLTADKAKYAMHEGVPSILVDDFGVNINAWKASGGIGIKYDDSAFPQVEKILEKIAKSGVPK